MLDIELSACMDEILELYDDGRKALNLEEVKKISEKYSINKTQFPHLLKLIENEGIEVYQNESKYKKYL